MDGFDFNPKVRQSSQRISDIETSGALPIEGEEDTYSRYTIKYVDSKGHEITKTWTSAEGLKQELEDILSLEGGTELTVSFNSIEKNDSGDRVLYKNLIHVVKDQESITLSKKKKAAEENLFKLELDQASNIKKDEIALSNLSGHAILPANSDEEKQFTSFLVTLKTKDGNILTVPIPTASEITRSDGTTISPLAFVIEDMFKNHGCKSVSVEFYTIINRELVPYNVTVLNDLNTPKTLPMAGKGESINYPTTIAKDADQKIQGLLERTGYDDNTEIEITIKFDFATPPVSLTFKGPRLAVYMDIDERVESFLNNNPDIVPDMDKVTVYEPKIYK